MLLVKSNSCSYGFVPGAGEPVRLAFSDAPPRRRLRRFFPSVGAGADGASEVEEEAGADVSKAETGADWGAGVVEVEAGTDGGAGATILTSASASRRTCSVAPESERRTVSVAVAGSTTRMVPTKAPPVRSVSFTVVPTKEAIEVVGVCPRRV